MQAPDTNADALALAALAWTVAEPGRGERLLALTAQLWETGDAGLLNGEFA